MTMLRMLLATQKSHPILPTTNGKRYKQVMMEVTGENCKIIHLILPHKTTTFNKCTCKVTVVVQWGPGYFSIEKSSFPIPVVLILMDLYINFLSYVICEYSSKLQNFSLTLIIPRKFDVRQAAGWKTPESQISYDINRSSRTLDTQCRKGGKMMISL